MTGESNQNHGYPTYDGWVLYYSEEGYPYYYNHETGESRWANYNQQSATDDETNGNTALKSKASEENDEENEEEEEENEENEDGDEDDADNEDEDDDEEIGEKFNDELERKFKQYLRTPEGIAAILSEQERISKHIDKQQKKQKNSVETEYFRKLFQKKKIDDDEDNVTSTNATAAASSSFGLNSAFSMMWKGFESFVDADSQNKKNEAKSSKDRKKEKEDTVAGKGSAIADRLPARNRRQSTNNSVPIVEGEREEFDEEKHLEITMDANSLPSSRSTSSSDLESLSSDDSDVEIINAPVLSEIPLWLQFPYLYEHYITPTQQYLVNSGIVDTSYALGQYCLSVGGQAAQQVAIGSFVLLENTFRVTYEASTTYVVPQLVQFMNDLVDQQQRLRATPVTTDTITTATTSVLLEEVYSRTPISLIPRGPPPFTASSSSYPPHNPHLPSTVAVSSSSSSSSYSSPYTSNSLPVTHAFPVAIPPSSSFLHQPQQPQQQQQQYTVAEKVMESYYTNDEQTRIPSQSQPPQSMVLSTDSIVLEETMMNPTAMKVTSYDSETLAALALTVSEEEEEEENEVVEATKVVQERSPTTVLTNHNNVVEDIAV